MSIGPVLLSFVLWLSPSSHGAVEIQPQPSVQKLEAAVKAAKEKVAREFATAAKLRQMGKLVDPDPESADAIVTTGGENPQPNDKRAAEAYIQAKSRYLLAKDLYLQADEALRAAKSKPRN